MTNSNSNTDFLPPIQDNEFLPPLGNWVIFGGLSVIFAIALAIPLASVVKYKEVVKAQASVRPAGELRIVQPFVEGEVKKILVRENQVVKRGESIATIDDSRLQSKKDRLEKNIQQARQQLIQIDAQIDALNSQISAETNRINRTVASAQAEYSRRSRDYRDRQIITTAEVKEAEANLKSAQAALNAAMSKRNRYQSVAKQGALSKDQLEEAQLAVQQQKQMVEAANAKVQTTKAALNPSDAEVAIAKEQIARERATREATLANLERERQALIQQQIETNKLLDRDRAELQQVKIDLSQTTISATADGIISQLNLRNPGQTIRAGEEVAQIAPSDVSLEVKTAVSPQDISKVKIGQPVSMKISACPYPDYGTLKGRVSQVSQDTIKPKQTDANSSSQKEAATAFYKVIIQPENFALGQDKNQCSITLGMEGRADIITREETVLKFLFLIFTKTFIMRHSKKLY